MIRMKKPQLKLVKTKPRESLAEELIRAVILGEDNSKIDKLVARINRRADLTAVGTHKCGLC